MYLFTAKPFEVHCLYRLVLTIVVRCSLDLAIQYMLYILAFKNICKPFVGHIIPRMRLLCSNFVRHSQKRKCVCSPIKGLYRAPNLDKKNIRSRKKDT